MVFFTVRGYSHFLFFFFALCSLLSAPSAFAQSITTGPSSNATRTTAAIYGTLASTNGTTNAVISRLFYGTSDGTNGVSWASSNVLASYTGAVPCTISNNLSSLTPSQLYYYRWHVIQGTNSAWASATSNFWTLAGAPTSAAPATAYVPVVKSTNTGASANWDPIYGPTYSLIGYQLSPTNVGSYPYGVYFNLEGGPGTYIGDQSSGAGIIGKRLSGSAVINDFSAGALIRGQLNGTLLITGAPAADQVGDFSGTARIYGSGYVSASHQWLYQAAGLAVINGAYGAWQIGYQASGVITNSGGHASLQIMSGAGTNIMTGQASLGIGSVIVSNNQAVVLGDGNQSHGNKSITAGSFWIGETNLGATCAAQGVTLGTLQNSNDVSAAWQGSVSNRISNMVTNGGTYPSLTVSNLTLWYQDTTNYSYITMDAGKFIMNGVSNGTLYAVTNTIY
jgi:hypothetical protein